MIEAGALSRYFLGEKQYIESTVSTSLMTFASFMSTTTLFSLKLAVKHVGTKYWAIKQDSCITVKYRVVNVLN